jgi:chitinase
MDTTAKKILSFGGWSFSTDYDTSPIFATGVSDANRELFATNVVQFLKDNKLDGLDFDWEVSFSYTTCVRHTY